MKSCCCFFSWCLIWTNSLFVQTKPKKQMKTLFNPSLDKSSLGPSKRNEEENTLVTEARKVIFATCFPLKNGFSTEPERTNVSYVICLLTFLIFSAIYRSCRKTQSLESKWRTECQLVTSSWLFIEVIFFFFSNIWSLNAQRWFWIFRNRLKLFFWRLGIINNELESVKTEWKIVTLNRGDVLQLTIRRKVPEFLECDLDQKVLISFEILNYKWV